MAESAAVRRGGRLGRNEASRRGSETGEWRGGRGGVRR